MQRWPLGGTALLLSACAALAPAPAPPPAAPPSPYASAYAAPAAPPVLIRGAVVLTGAGERLDGADVLIENGRIAQVGRRLSAPAGAGEVSAAGRWVTPGVIDAHSHLGVYPSPGVWPTAQGNEMTAPVTAEVWAEHSLWPQDPGFAKALAGGVTSMLILPGSANLIGGRGVVVRNVPDRTVADMKFPGAPHALKMACGENPRRVYGRDAKRAPLTNMGNTAGYRAAFQKAADYRRKWRAHRDAVAAGKAGADKQPDTDLQLETLAGVLDGEILVHNHCYRADEMAHQLALAQEFGFRISAFHHAVEAYKIPDVLAQAGACAAMWADWWGFKLEAYDGVRENVAMVHAAGGCAIVHSDDEYGIQRLNQEAAKAMAAGNRAGLAIPPEQAIRWITSNPARAMGILDQTGTLEPGKRADVVVWSGDPFSVYTHADLVFVDGVLRYDRADPATHRVSDFELGQGVAP